MSEEILRGRCMALEESFFAKQKEKLRRALQEQEKTKLKKEALATASGINDSVVLDELIALGIDVDTVAALTLVSLVEIAWARGSIDDKHSAQSPVRPGNWVDSVAVREGLLRPSAFALRVAVCDGAASRF